MLNNDVSDTVKRGTGDAMGIRFVQVSAGLAVNNRITGADIGISYLDISGGKFRDNLTSAVATPFPPPSSP